MMVPENIVAAADGGDDVPWQVSPVVVLLLEVVVSFVTMALRLDGDSEGQARPTASAKAMAPTSRPTMARGPSNPYVTAALSKPDDCDAVKNATTEERGTTPRFKSAAHNGRAPQLQSGVANPKSAAASNCKIRRGNMKKNEDLDPVGSCCCCSLAEDCNHHCMESIGNAIHDNIPVIITPNVTQGKASKTSTCNLSQ